METVVSIFSDKFKVKRSTACILTIAICLFLGIPSSLGFGLWGGVKIIGLSFLDFFDFISNSVLMPIVAFLTCIFVGYVIKPKTLADEISRDGTFGREKVFTVMIKYLAPICIVLILVSSVLDVFGIFKI